MVALVFSVIVDIYAGVVDVSVVIIGLGVITFVDVVTFLAVVTVVVVVMVVNIIIAGVVALDS